MAVRLAATTGVGILLAFVAPAHALGFFFGRPAGEHAVWGGAFTVVCVPGGGPCSAGGAPAIP